MAPPRRPDWRLGGWPEDLTAVGGALNQRDRATALGVASPVAGTGVGAGGTN